MSALTRICPTPRAARPLPKWALGALVASYASSFLGGHASSWWWALGWLPGVAGAFALALWLEDRVALRFARHSLVVVVGCLLGAVVAQRIVALVFHTLFLMLGFDNGAWLVLQLFLFWFASAALGGLPIWIVNVSGARFFDSFRHRVQVAVLLLMAIASSVAVLVAVLGLTLADAVHHNDAHVLLSPTSVAGFDIGRERFARDVLPLFDTPSVIVVLSGVVAALYGVPAVLSASRKLADSVMERITPLAAGFDRLAEGDRSVEVEEGGAFELRHIVRRFNSMVGALALAERMERAFGQYVSNKVLGLIKRQHGEATLPAATRTASVFFADIRGFTAMSEQLAPAQVVSILNRYFERVVTLVEEHDGYLNKFIGDAVVVVFNAPLDQPDHAARATQCAIALQKVVSEMNAAQAFPEIGELKVGVGVATGPMVCGNIGGARQMEYTVIGDTVNLASRLTSKAAAGEVWISEATARELPASVPVQAMEPVAVKGKTEPVRPFRAWP
jgi:class 3 adenylate cyclase